MEIKELEKFEPFGMNNRKPLFATYKMRISDIRTVGNGKHLKFKVSSGFNSIDVIAFGMGAQADQLKPGQTVDLAYNFELDTYNGNEKLQLIVKDIK